MEKAVWLASIFGPFLGIMGLWMLLYHENLIKVWTSIKNTPGLFYLSGVFNLLIGLSIMSQYNMWSWHLSVLISLLGWVLMIRGLISLFIPQLLIKVMMAKATSIRVMGLIPLLWGIALCSLAFF